MKFVEEFKAGYVMSSGPAGTPHKGIYVDSRDVYDLLVFLKGNNVEIDKKASHTGYGETLVPLGTLFPDNRRPTSYLLKGENLEISLENWSDNPFGGPSIGPKVIGGSTTNVTGVECKLEKTLIHNEDPHEAINSFLETCKIVSDFYNALREESGLLKRLRGQG